MNKKLGIQMQAKNYEFIPLKWDSDYFGISCARVNLTGTINKNEKEDIIKLCSGYDFVTISNLDNNKLNNHWIGIETNAFLVDMNIQLIKELDHKPVTVDKTTFVFNDYQINEQVLDIANGSFQYSRFFNDPKLPEDKAKNIYQHWTESAFERDDKYFVICEKDSQVLGYILFSLEKDSSVIELIAVNKDHQRKNVGKMMIQAMESYMIDKGSNKIKVGTQVSNISALQFYSKMGFIVSSCNSVYHMWK